MEAENGERRNDSGWVLACDVQQRFMLGLELTMGSIDHSASCRQVRAWAGIAMISYRSRETAWPWLWEMPPEKGWWR